MDDLIANYRSALVWNRPGSPRYWFHYTERTRARAIVASKTFKVGTKHTKGRAGVYVCPYAPGSRTEEDLAGRILDGSYHEREKLRAVVVLASGPDITFESDPDTRDGMRHLADPGSLVELPNQIVGWAAIVDGQWQHSLTLFDPLALP
ncbi:MAG TPA: hypothetical protein VGW75_15740 [Solirubrobacteraceae bacterium]|nr:hypothetical protein [Solirubrobacteraceae bacterium]